MVPGLTSVLNYLNSLTDRADLPRVERILFESGVSVADVASLCIFNDSHYARNKVAEGTWYDLYVMCWKPGQTSKIHDHKDSSCVFKILEGTATEIGCELTSAEKRHVRKTRVTEFTLGECCAAQDAQIHQIANVSPTENLITMHIYSPPLKMSVYEWDPREIKESATN